MICRINMRRTTTCFLTTVDLWLRLTPLLLWSVQRRTRSTNSYHYRGGEGKGWRRGAGFTIIIINGAANESCRLNNSCATHDLPVPLSLPLVSFFFFPPFSLSPSFSSSFRWIPRAQMRESTSYKWGGVGGPETWWHSDCTHRYKSTVCARINRDVTTLFCRSSAFPLALSSPPRCFLRVSTDFISPRNNDIS